MRITVLAGGIGAARFLRGLRCAAPTAEVTVVGNTGDDITLWGLRVCPDLDTVMYTLGGGIDEAQGWGRADERFLVQEELASYGLEPQWFTLGDRDVATHIARTQLLRDGWSLSQVTERLCRRWKPGVALLPMSDDPAETHVLVGEPGAEHTLHFQEWWIRERAALPARAFRLVGAGRIGPAPGVLDAIAGADVVLLPPSNPVVSIGSVLQVDGIADAVRRTSAPVVGVSPIVAGAAVRGMAAACLQAIRVETTAEGVAAHYGARRGGGLIDGWLVHEGDDARVPGMAIRAAPLLMTDLEATTAMAARALELALEVA